jgi:hypothetical protein
MEETIEPYCMAEMEQIIQPDCMDQTEQTIDPICMAQIEQTIQPICMPFKEPITQIGDTIVSHLGIGIKLDIKKAIEKLNQIKLNSSCINISKNADILINEFEKLLIGNQTICKYLTVLVIHYEIFTLCNDNNKIKKQIINSNNVLSELNELKRSLRGIKLEIRLSHLQLFCLYKCQIDGYDYNANKVLVDKYIFEIDKFIKSDFMTKDDVVYMSYEKIMYDKTIDNDVNIIKRIKTVNGNIKFLLFQSDDYVLLEKN